MRKREVPKILSFLGICKQSVLVVFIKSGSTVLQDLRTFIAHTGNLTLFLLKTDGNRSGTCATVFLFITT